MKHCFLEKFICVIFQQQVANIAHCKPCDESHLLSTDDITIGAISRQND